MGYSDTHSQQHRVIVCKPTANVTQKKGSELGMWHVIKGTNIHQLWILLVSDDQSLSAVHSLPCRFVGLANRMWSWKIEKSWARNALLLSLARGTPRTSTTGTNKLETFLLHRVSGFPGFSYFLQNLGISWPIFRSLYAAKPPDFEEHHDTWASARPQRRSNGQWICQGPGPWRIPESLQQCVCLHELFF